MTVKELIKQLIEPDVIVTTNQSLNLDTEVKIQTLPLSNQSIDEIKFDGISIIIS
jgi:hypothetical protein